MEAGVASPNEGDHIVHVIETLRVFNEGVVRSKATRVTPQSKGDGGVDGAIPEQSSIIITRNLFRVASVNVLSSHEKGPINCQTAGRNACGIDGVHCW